MKIERYEQNPLITPADVKPYHDGFEVIGAFNAGIAEYNGEVLMLLRVAERPISPDPNIVLAPVYNVEHGGLDLIEIRKDDDRYDLSDPRVIVRKENAPAFEYLTSLSYLRIARSRVSRSVMRRPPPLLVGPPAPMADTGA